MARAGGLGPPWPCGAGQGGEEWNWPPPPCFVGFPFRRLHFALLALPSPRPPPDSGFADEPTQAAKLMAVFRHFNTDKDGWISFEEFQAALVRLNFVGVQREVRGANVCLSRPLWSYLTPWPLVRPALALQSTLPCLPGLLSPRADQGAVRPVRQRRQRLPVVRGGSLNNSPPTPAPHPPPPSRPPTPVLAYRPFVCTTQKSRTWWQGLSRQ